MLPADTGLTKSEIDVWRQFVSNSRWKHKGRMAVLNKIDGLWDALKTEGVFEKELNKQIITTSEVLGLDAQYIFPTSAQKGLQGKISQDEALLARS